MGLGVLLCNFGQNYFSMEEERMITEITVEEPMGESTAREELMALLNEVLPAEKRGEDVEKMALEYIKEQQGATDRLVEAISQDPRLAQVLADLVAGKRKAGPALARYFGKEFLTAQEGTPEYEEMMAADEELLNERENAKRAKAENEAKMVEFFDWLEEELKDETGEKGDMLKRVYEEIIVPLLDGVKDKELPMKLMKALRYDKDTEDAFAAGEVKGRNTNIHEMRAKVGDGMPKGLTSQGAPTEVKQKRRINPLLADALNA